MIAKPIVTDKYFSKDEIKKHLQNVEYIIMVAPAPASFTKTPIHFTIFLNTSDALCDDIKKSILNKFSVDNDINNIGELISELMPIGFSMSSQDTPMPLLLIKKEDQQSIEYTLMHTMDFLADSDNFYEVKINKLTGWTYSYNQ